MKNLDNYNYLTGKIKEKDEKAINNALKSNKYDWDFFPEDSIPLINFIINEHLSDLCINILNAKPNLNVDAEGVDGLAPLHYAILNNKNELISRLIIKGADIEKHSPFGSPLRTALVNYNMDAAYLLILNGADTSEWLSESLFLAVAKNNLPLCKILLEQGADPNYSFSDVSCYMMALKNDFTDITDLLVKAGAWDFEAEDVDKSLAEKEWFDMVELNNELILRIYIAKGVNITIKNEEGKNALDIARENDYKNIVDFLEVSY